MLHFVDIEKLTAFAAALAALAGALTRLLRAWQRYKLRAAAQERLCLPPSP